MTSLAIRHKLYDYIRTADEKKIHALYCLLEDEIGYPGEWQNDKVFQKELESRYAALESGSDKGVTLDQLQISVEKLRQKKYGR